MNKIKLFLTEVDQHHPRPLIDRRLRAYIILHALFFDRLLVGDSQFNNNINLRSLIWNSELIPSTTSKTLRDFSLLLQEGYLLPTIRQDYSSLESLRQEHENRKIDNVPPKEFVELAEQYIGNERESYDGETVGAVFRKRCLIAFSSPDNYGKGKLSKDKQNYIYDYLAGQDHLLYKSLREWAEKEMKASRFTNRDYRLFDRIVSGAYRHNVPLALDVNIDMPLLESRDPFPITFDFGDKEGRSSIFVNKHSGEWDLPPALHLSSSFLSLIPAESLIYIKGSKNKDITPLPSYKKVIGYLESFRSRKSISTDALLDDFSHFLKETEVIVTEHLGRKPKISYLERKRKAKSKAKIDLVVDGTLSAIGFIPIVGNIVSIIYAAYGGLQKMRNAMRQEDYIDGVINGKSSIAESLLLETSRGKSNGS